MRIGILYAHGDADFARTMTPLLREPGRKLVDLREDLHIGVDELAQRLEKLNGVDVLILLYSPDFIAEFRGGTLLQEARYLHERAWLWIIAAYVRHVHLDDRDWIHKLLVPPTPIDSAKSRDEAVAQISKQLALTAAEIRMEITGNGGREGEATMSTTATQALWQRPRSGELLLGRYRLVRRLRHDAWISEWVAVDEQLRDDSGAGRQVIVHMLGPRSSGAENDGLRRRVFDRVKRLAGEGLAGLGDIIEPQAADGTRHLFITENAWREPTPEWSTGTSLRFAAAQRRQGSRWIPQLLHVGQQLARLHERRGSRRGLVHGAVNPDNIVVDAPGGPTLVGLNVFAGEKIWRRVLDRDPDELSFLPPHFPVGMPSELSARCDVFGFAATVLFALLDGEVGAATTLKESCERLKDPAQKTALLRVLDEEQDAHFPTMAELCEDLRRAYLSASGSASPAMIEVAGGEFWMGRQTGDEEARPHEVPRRRVRVSSFQISRDLVPQALFLLLMGGHPGTQPWGLDVPATRVSFIDAAELCNRMSTLEGLPPAYTFEGDSVSWDRRSTGFRLPTEAEWEYAAAGPCREDEEPRLYPWGDLEPAAHACWNGPGHGHRKGNERGPCPAGTHESGSSPFGVRDMAGGVCEWCWDWFRPYEEERQPLVDPVGPPSCLTPQGYEERPYRIVRGGAWNQKAARWLRCSARYLEDQDERPREIGLRVVRGAITVPPGEDPVVS